MYKNSEIFKYMKNPSETIQKLAVLQHSKYLECIKEPLPEMCEIAIQQSGLSLQWVNVEKRTPELCLSAVKQNGLALI